MHVCALSQISIYLQKMPDESRVRQMLHCALDYYLQFLAMNTATGASSRQSPVSNTSIVFRVCGLWFGNPGDAQVNMKLRTMIGKLPTYVFLPLTHQIASHLEKTAKHSTFHVSEKEQHRSRARVGGNRRRDAHCLARGVWETLNPNPN